MNQGTILGRPVVKWIALAALVAVLVALLPGGLLQAQGGTTIEYMENSTVPVITLSAADPETASPIVWSLADVDDFDDVINDDVADNASFNISQGGVLTFKTSPSFEAMSVSNNDSYQVVVQASDGSMPSYFKVTVNVLDEEEEGSVKLQPAGLTNATTLLQPQEGIGITAHTLTDPDGNTTARTSSDIVEAATWQWYRSSSKTATGTAISTGTAATYTPVAADVGHHLRVEATYNDGRGGGKIAQAVSEYMTIARIASNTAPEFPATSTTRAVLEETDAGTSIGNPVTATDADSGERLTYWLTENDAALFTIDAKTGQLKVKTKLNYEGILKDGDVIDQCRADNACQVTVNAADSSGIATDPPIGVTISVIAVDEKPTFDLGPTAITLVEGMTALAADRR